MASEQKSFLSYFHTSFFFTFVGLGIGFAMGWFEGGWQMGINLLFLCAVLSVLEVSLSFDNAVVNAAVLRNMTELWRHRFLTWGILIAVFGMRLIFPVAIVSLATGHGPWGTLVLAAREPAKYAEIMQSVHVPVAAFGGAFLLMVALKYFFDANKEVHWIRIIEEPLTKLGRLEAIELGVAMVTLYGISLILNDVDARSFLAAGLLGLVTFVIVDGINVFLKVPETEGAVDLNKASAGMFLYLEVLDASFSFDGVIGAFAITKNLFIIMIGLGIGAFFVRSITILMVEKGTLDEYRYVEHGAFWAIGVLAAIMFANTFVHIPEAVTGLLGGILIGLSLWSSVRYNRAHALKGAKA